MKKLKVFLLLFMGNLGTLNNIYSCFHALTLFSFSLMLSHPLSFNFTLYLPSHLWLVSLAFRVIMLEKGLGRRGVNLLSGNGVLSDVYLILWLPVPFLCQCLLDEQDVLLGHLVHFLGHDVCLILLILGYFSDNA